MKRIFNDLASYVHRFDGAGKPEIDFRTMYALFPNFSFEAWETFGSYRNFGKAFGRKEYNMTVTDGAGNECYLHYYRYQDAPENLVYLD